MQRKEGHPVLYQNIPNPFDQTTTIEAYLPENTTSAELYIFNMQGIQLKKVAFTQTGKAEILVNASELQAGMYLYTLVVDGKEVDSKRMLLTD
ncbi:MAG: T9SS type A sorting domain-containing protein [Bacteroidales bacterium]|nr:T9SS type A sorting domain-containing protein [Bacteroidales bacterium]